MAFVLGLVGGAIRNAMRGDREQHQPGHGQHYSSSSSSYDYNSPYYQPAYPGPDNRYQRDFCDPYHTYDSPAPVSRRQYKRECKRSRRAERHARRAEAFGMPATSRTGPAVYSAAYLDTRPGWRSYPGMAGEHGRDVGHATMPAQSQNYPQNYGQGSSRNTDGRGYAAEARPPPVYATRERRASLDEGVPDEADAPPAYERFSTPGGSGAKAH
ncbi:hypothetical protein KJ359_012725 [Pestalotiopsis sp. 9143b]|nr:hypothetical protein KJ359_012725 [Pestalotiopsis sp. 9143b]